MNKSKRANGRRKPAGGLSDTPPGVAAPKARGGRKPPDNLARVPPPEALPAADGEPAEKPRWDAARHEFWLGNVLLKRFRRPAPVVELILAAFEEEGWPPHIDDPLVPLVGHQQKRRLRNAVHNLNRRLNARFMHFETDGFGKGVCWHRV